jgi:hypothetical protein
VPRSLFLAARSVLESHAPKGKVPRPLLLTSITCFQTPMGVYLLAKDPLGVLLLAVPLVGVYPCTVYLCGEGFCYPC